MSIATDHWTGSIVAYGIRYGLGRASYAVGVCCDWLRAHWRELDDRTRAGITRDIQDHLNESDDATPLINEWRNLMAWIVTQPAESPDAPPVDQP